MPGRERRLRLIRAPRARGHQEAVPIPTCSVSGCVVFGASRRGLGGWQILAASEYKREGEGEWEEKQDVGESAPTLLCEFRTWNGNFDATPELEETSAKDPLARESWEKAVEWVIPPMVAWVQERWDLRVFRLNTPEDDEGDL
ncbi:hypothetical protein HD806DRAFT_514354 [Xylariaceae sp. AK1471]|nr:hypothetical protein HD806DRAFT_514354 [Xylariaceae sp. AK1471]